MKHIVDTVLPETALNAVKSGIADEDINIQYQEPIVALQDLDWEPPENIEYAYYAIYNLYRKYINNEYIDDWIIANQALSSIEEKKNIKQILIEAVENVI
ncbi:MAG: hypothetical protein ABIK92_18675 [Pseudomonadota bacterium]